MNVFMAIFWLMLVVGSATALCESDARKMKDWHGRTIDHAFLSRVIALPFLLLAIWQLYVLWAPK